MLYDTRGGDKPRLTMLEDRKDIDLTDHIAMRLKPTRRATIVAPSWFVAPLAGGASLRTIPLFDQLDGDPFGFSFVLDKFSDLAMVPTADFLIGLFTQVHAIGNISHIADYDFVSFVRNGNIYDSATNLVFDIAHDPLVLGLHPGLRAQQPPVATAAFFLSRQRFLYLCQPFGMALLLVAPFSTGDDRGLSFVAYNGRVYLAQINRYDVVPRRGLGLFAVFNDDMPMVTTCFPIVDKAHLQDAQDILKMDRQSDLDFGIAPTICEGEFVAGALDCRAKPEGRTEFLWPVREPGVDTSLPQCPGRGAGIVETVLCSINGMGVQLLGRIPVVPIVEFGCSVVAQPMTVVA